MEVRIVGILVGAAVALVVSALIASKFGEIAEMKGYEKKPYFLFSFLFGIAGWLMVVALPNLSAREYQEPVKPVKKNVEKDELPDL